MTPTQFRAALDRLGWTQAQAAEQLEISIRSVNGYANGAPIPKLVELALAYFSSVWDRHNPWTSAGRVREHIQERTKALVPPPHK